MNPYLAAAAGCAWLSLWASAWRAALGGNPVNVFVRMSAHELRRRAKGKVLRFPPSAED